MLLFLTFTAALNKSVCLALCGWTKLLYFGNRNHIRLTGAVELEITGLNRKIYSSMKQTKQKDSGMGMVRQWKTLGLGTRDEKT